MFNRNPPRSPVIKSLVFSCRYMVIQKFLTDIVGSLQVIPPEGHRTGTRVVVVCAILALLLRYSSNKHITYHFIMYGLVDLRVSLVSVANNTFMGEGCSPDRVLV